MTSLEEFYSSTAWKRCRAAYKQKVGGLCEDCLEKGLYTPAALVHHMIPVDESNMNDPSITLNFDNLRAVCRFCHAKRHGARQGQRYFCDRDGHVTILPDNF